MFLQASDTEEAAAYLENERASTGYVMNLERVWAWRPEVAESFVALRKQLMESSSLTAREFAVLVCATAHTLSDSYCALAWGPRLAAQSDAATAAAVLSGTDANTMSARERALRRWAEQIVRAPSSTRAEQVEALRAAGLTDREIFDASAFVAFRLAFATVNDALGARPDAALVAAAPAEVRAAVTYGRPPMA